MARNLADACIFCGEQACQCGKPAKKKVTKSPATINRVRATPRASSSPSDSKTGREVAGVSAVKEDSSATPPSRERPNLSTLSRVRDHDLEAEAAAVTIFAEADMLHRDSLVELRHLIRLPTHQVDALIWRQDNAEAVHKFAAGSDDRKGA